MFPCVCSLNPPPTGYLNNLHVAISTNIIEIINYGERMSLSSWIKGTAVTFALSSLLSPLLKDNFTYNLKNHNHHTPSLVRLHILLRLRFSHRYIFVVVWWVDISPVLYLLALHVLTDGVELFVHSATAVQVTGRSHDIDRAYLGALDRRHRVLAQHLKQYVADDDGKASHQHPDERVLV